jgi:4,5:9,10-diseco-3-hydroxy-5,9,17-trioxoandrosta-1(10),2-diene-4-oate hydrolase
MLSRHLSASAMYPAGRGDLTTRWLALAGGARVRALECGPPDGAPLLFVHGWCCSLYTFRKSYRALADAGYRVMAADLKGHGLSDKPLRAGEYTADAMAAHVLQVMDAFGVHRATIVAHSMGGAIATRTALRAPDRVNRLILLAPVGFGEVNLMSVVKLLTPAVINPALRYLVPRWAVAVGLRLAYGEHGRPEPQDVDEYWAPTQFPDFVRAMRELAHAFPWDAVTEEDLRRLRTPTLVMFGTGDRLVGPGRAEELSRALPNGRCELVPGAGHALPEEAPDWVNAAIADFARSAVAA